MLDIGCFNKSVPPKTTVAENFVENVQCFCKKCFNGGKEHNPPLRFLKIYVVQKDKLSFKKAKNSKPQEKQTRISFAEKIRVLRKRKIF